jgi:CheY-like chemotaxis protein
MKEAAGPQSDAKRKLRVLVVDDNIDQVRTLAYLVRDTGHHVDYAINGFVALELLERMKPDVLVLDVVLPDATGFEIVRHLRRNPELKGTYVIGVTGQQIDRADALSRGFDQLLNKPVHFRDLELALAQVP